MRAREAEKLIAELLSKKGVLSGPGTSLSSEDLVGFDRSRPIYARKLQELQKKQRGAWRSMAVRSYRALRGLMRRLRHGFRTL